MPALPLALLLALAAVAHARADDSTIASRLDALERGLAAAHQRIDQLEQLNNKLLDTVGVLQDELTLLRSSPYPSSDAMRMCLCDAFNSSTVTLGPGSAGGNVNLNVGSPETGFINGVNINQLSNEAVLNYGSQSISGSLTVDLLSIGGLWTLTVDGDGNLDVQSTVGTGGMVVQGPITANGAVSATGVSTFDAVSVQSSLNATSVGTTSIEATSIETGSLGASSLSASSSYNLCTGGVCISQYPQFQTLEASGGSGSAACPGGWVMVSAYVCCYYSGNEIWWQPMNIAEGATSINFSCDRGSECGDSNEPNYYTCMIAS